MSSWCEGETFRYVKPELKEEYVECCCAFDKKESLPEVEYEYFTEDYMRAWGFSWSEDIVRLIQKDNAMELKREHHSIMDWTDTEGGVHREDGRAVPYVDCTTKEGKTCASISYDDIEWVYDYLATQYDFKTKKKKVFKMIEVSEEDMNEYDLKKFEKEIFTAKEIEERRKAKEDKMKKWEEDHMIDPNSPDDLPF